MTNAYQNDLEEASGCGDEGNLADGGGEGGQEFLRKLFRAGRAVSVGIAALRLFRVRRLPAASTCTACNK